MKKFLSLLVAVTMLVGIMPIMNVFAADTSNETKDVTSVGWTYSDWQASEGYTLYGASHKISPSVTYQGTGAMHLTLDSDGDAKKSDGINYTNDRYVIRVNSNNTAQLMEPGNKYHVSFYTKINTIELTPGKVAAAQVNIAGKAIDITADSQYLAVDDDNDGWRKFEIEYDVPASATEKRLAFWIGGAAADLYIDNIVLAKVTNGVIGENILPEIMTNFDNNSFEFSSSEGETVDIRTVGWAPNNIASSANNARKVLHHISNNESYEGSGSMHLQYWGDGVAGFDRYSIRSDHASHKLDGSSKYKLTMYVKILNNSQQDEGSDYTASVVLGDSGTINLINSNPLLVDTGKDGWKKLEKTITSNSNSNRLEIFIARGCADLYIDSISICKDNGDGTYGENIFADKGEMMYNFDEDTPVTPSEPWTDADVTPVTPDTNEKSIGALGWELSRPGSNNNPNAGTAGISTATAYEGNSSMHITFEKDSDSSTNDYIVVRPKADSGYAFETGKTYKVTMYIRPITNTADGIQAYFYSYSKIGTFGKGSFTKADKPGWYKYEDQGTCDGVTRLQLGASEGICDFYVDSISVYEVTNNVVGTTNLFEGEFGTFDSTTPEGGDTPVTPTEPWTDADVTPVTPDANEKAIGDYGWELSRPGSNNNPNAGTAGISTATAYEGKSSMHVTFEKDSDSSTNDYIIIRPKSNDANNLVVGNKYKVTMYIRPITNTADGIGIKFWSHASVAKFGNNSGKLVKADKPGWYKYEDIGTCTTESSRVQIPVDAGVCDFYIDNVSVYDVTGDVVGTTNRFEGKIGTFETESSGGGEAGDTPVTPSEPWTDADVEPVMPSNVTDFTGVSAADYGWEASNFDGGNGTIEVSSATSYEGKSSLHVKYSKTAEKDYTLIRPVNKDENNLVKGTKYKVTMYIRPVVNTADGIGAKFISHATAVSFGNTKGKITKADKPGWYKYEDEGVVELERIHLMANGGICEFYVDNVSVCIVDETGVVGENRFADKRGTFEAEGATGYTVSGPKLYDADGNNITDITEEVSGKTITAAVAVANYTEADTFTAEVIVCLYKDNVLQETVMSGTQTIKTTDSAKFITKDIVLPEISAEDADEYTLRVFTWESIGAMAPLSLSTAF